MFLAPVNTGVPSGCDFNHDGKSEGPQDCFGYGFHPGECIRVLVGYVSSELIQQAVVSQDPVLCIAANGILLTRLELSQASDVPTLKCMSLCTTGIPT